MDLTVSSLVAPWADLYAGSTAVSTGVTSLHLAGMLLGGGFAVAADRATLRALRHPRALAHHLDELESVHRLVLSGLGVTIATGLLMLAADLESMVRSPVFWVKMAALAVLLANGWRLRGAARRLRRDIAGSPTARSRLGGAARLSAGLWFAALLLGAMLPSV
jgi:hypothetical protein